MRPCLACLTKPNPRAVSFGIAQAAARRTAINTASRQQRRESCLQRAFPGARHNQRDRLIFDWRVRRPVRSQMGLIAGNADIPDSRHLWWLNGGKGHLTKTIRQLARRVVKLGYVSGRFLDTSFRRSRSKSSPNSERLLISFCASIACCLHSSFDLFLVDAIACRCAARLPARVKK